MALTNTNVIENVVKEEFGVVKNKKVLEIVCGYGRFAKIFHAHNNISKYVLADAQKLPFRSNSFDLVFCNFALHHIKDVEKIISEVSRVLKKDGWFYCIEPNGSWWYAWRLIARYNMKDKKCFGDEEHAIYPNDVKRFLIKHKMSPTITYRSTYLPIVHDKLGFLKNSKLSNCMVIRARRV